MLLDRVYTLHISGLRRCVAIPSLAVRGRDRMSKAGLGKSMEPISANAEDHAVHNSGRLPMAGCGEGNSSRDPNKLSQSPSRIADAPWQSLITAVDWRGRLGKSMVDQRRNWYLTFVRIKHVNSHVKIRPCHNGDLPSSQLCRNEERLSFLKVSQDILVKETRDGDSVGL